MKILEDGIEDLEGLRFKKLVGKLHSAQEKFKCVPSIAMRSSISTPQIATTAGPVTRRNSRLIDSVQENYYLEAHISPEKTV